MSEVKVVPKEFNTWSKAEVEKAGFPTDTVAVVKGDKFASFNIQAPAQMTVYGGTYSSSFYCNTVDQQHKGSGYANSSFESGSSTGQVSCTSWSQLQSSYYITATAINGSIYCNFANYSNTQVGFYAGTWAGSSVQQANGYFWWNS